MTIDINRHEIAVRYNNERKGNKFGFGLKYTNAEIRTKVLSDLFTDWAWPGGYPVVFVTSDGDILCAACAKDAVLNNRESVYTDIYYEGPAECCAGCNREIESAYGDPDAEDAEEEETAPQCTCYGINIHDSTCPLWEDPMTADDYAGMHVFNG